MNHSGPAPGSRERCTPEGASVAERPSSRPGFTLLELLVVIAVMALLAALLFPVLARARARARQSSCLTNVRQIGMAHLLYLQDYHKQLPHWWQAGPPRPQPFGPYVYWTGRLQPYLHSVTVFSDPGTTGWQPMPPELKLADYALITWGSGGTGTARDPYWSWPGPPLSLAQVKRPAQAIQLSDGYTTTSTAGGMVAEHSGGANVGFLDGHAQWMTRKQAYIVTQDEQGYYYYRFVRANR